MSKTGERDTSVLNTYVVTGFLASFVICHTMAWHSDKGWEGTGKIITEAGRGPRRAPPHRNLQCPPGRLKARGCVIRQRRTRMEMCTKLVFRWQLVTSM